jgi:DNA polymerase
VAVRYRIGEKGTEVLDALGKHLDDFSVDELAAYGDYCINDVELTYKLFGLMGANFPRQELKLIDCTLRMFVKPVLDIDTEALREHLTGIRSHKEGLVKSSHVTKDILMSNDKFADALMDAGFVPPTKVSPTTGKKTYAFAKTDKEFQAMLKHNNPIVKAMAEARLGIKSTLEETRTQRFIDIAGRGVLPVPIKYYAAHTGRWGGDDKINMQNLPSRGNKSLKDSIRAPEGHTLIDCDSSQIEARVLAWLAGQDDLVESFDKGEDVYKKMAADIYYVEVEDVTKEQRFVGKTAILGAGYGMGALRFKEQLKAQSGVDIETSEAQRIISVYRASNWKIAQFWRNCQNMLVSMYNKDSASIGTNKLISSMGQAIKLPSGLLMRYDDLDFEQGEKGKEFSYLTRKGRTRIYGGKVTENICQAVARCIIGEQMLLIAKKYKVVMTVHDSIVCSVMEDEIEQAQTYIEKCMRYVPTWCEGMPLDCESGTGKSYGGCE